MNSSQLDSEKDARKPYVKPQLQIYGDLRQITQATSAGKKNDNAMTAPNNTV
jgi:hypothetical protein